MLNAALCHLGTVGPSHVGGGNRRVGSNVHTQAEERDASTVESPYCRTGHSLTYSPQLKKCFVFGGIPSISPSQDDALTMCPLLSLSVAELVEVTTEDPTARARRQQDSSSSNSNASLSLRETEDKLWTECRAPAQPLPRHGHWTHLLTNQETGQESLFVLGGRHWTQDDLPASSVVFYQLPGPDVNRVQVVVQDDVAPVAAEPNLAGHWYMLENFNVPSRFAPAACSVPLTNFKRKGRKNPSRRFAITGVEVEVSDDVSFVLGGLNEAREVTDNLFSVNFRTKEIIHLNGQGSRPPPQFKGAMSMSPGLDSLFLLDGFPSDAFLAAAPGFVNPTVRSYNFANNMWTELVNAPDIIRSQLVSLAPTRPELVVVNGGMPRGQKLKGRSKKWHTLDIEFEQWVGRWADNKTQEQHYFRKQLERNEGGEGGRAAVNSSGSALASRDDLSTSVHHQEDFEFVCDEEAAAQGGEEENTNNGSSTKGVHPQFPGLTSHTMIHVPNPRATTQRFDGAKSRSDDFSSLLICFGGSTDSTEHRHTDGEPVGFPCADLHLYSVTCPTLKELCARKWTTRFAARPKRLVRSTSSAKSGSQERDNDQEASSSAAESPNSNIHEMAQLLRAGAPVPVPNDEDGLLDELF